MTKKRGFAVELLVLIILLLVLIIILPQTKNSLTGSAINHYSTEETRKIMNYSFIVNNVPCIINITTPINNSYYNTAFRINATITDNDDLSSIVVVAANSSGFIIVNNTQPTTGISQNINDLINVSSSGFVDGTYLLTVSVTDGVCETARLASSFIVDKTIPIIDRINRAPDIIHNNNSVFFSIRVRDDWLNDSLVFLETNASGNWLSYSSIHRRGNRFNFTLTGKSNLSLGKHLGYRFSATDLARNTHVTENDRFLVNNRLPSAAIISPSANSTLEIGTSVLFTAQGNDLDEENLTYTWNYGLGDNAVGQNQSYVYNRTGSFTVNITVADALNRSSTSIPITILDTTAPVISSINYDSEVHLQQDTNLTVTATATDHSGIFSFNLTIIRISYNHACSLTNTSMNCTWVVNNLAVGNYSFNLTSTDMAAQSNSTTYLFTVTSCADSIQNGNEQGIDCGGGCNTSCYAGSLSSPSSQISYSSTKKKTVITQEDTTSLKTATEVVKEISQEPANIDTADSAEHEETTTESQNVMITDVKINIEPSLLSKSITGLFSALLADKIVTQRYSLTGLIIAAIFGIVYLAFREKS